MAPEELAREAPCSLVRENYTHPQIVQLPDPCHEFAGGISTTPHFVVVAWLAQRTQGQTDTCRDGVPCMLFLPWVGEIKAVDGASDKVAATIKYYTFSFRRDGEKRPGDPVIIQ